MMFGGKCEINESLRPDTELSSYLYNITLDEGQVSYGEETPTFQIYVH